jgi:hypothetical protein
MRLPPVVEPYAPTLVEALNRRRFCSAFIYADTLEPVDADELTEPEAL